jgi:hypothetical protein
MINGNYRSIVQFGIGVMLREQMLERNYEKISLGFYPLRNRFYRIGIKNLISSFRYIANM